LESSGERWASHYADEMHYSLGIGLAFKRFQIDAAVDLSERVDTVSISGIFGF